MLELQTPRVYYEHIDSSRSGIRGIRTDIAGFVGLAERGPLDTPVPVESFRQFTSWFGEFAGIGYLAYAIRGFFENGGKRCWIIRVASTHEALGANPASVVINDAVGTSIWKISAGSPGTWGNALAVSVRTEMKAQTVVLDPGGNDAFAHVVSTSGFERGVLVQISQPGWEARRVVSHVDPIRKRLYWVNPDHGKRLVYDQPLVGFDPSVALTIQSQTYAIAVRLAGRVVENWVGLSLVPEHTSYGPLVLQSPQFQLFRTFEQQKPVSPTSIIIESLENTLGTIPAPLNIKEGTSLPLVGGMDGLANLEVGDFIGERVDPFDSDARKQQKIRGIRALDLVDEISIVAVPDIHIRPDRDSIYLISERPSPNPCITCPPQPESVAPFTQPKRAQELPPIFSLEAVYQVQAALIQHCEERGDRVALIDPPFTTAQENALGLSAVQAWRSRFDSTYAAFFHPWLLVVEPRGQKPVRSIPPSGHAAGQFVLNDLEIGVHKAPANRVLQWVQDITVKISDTEHGLLNTIGINAIRAESGRGLRIMGARTLSSDPDWRYINVRRLLIMIRKAIDLSMQWAVFDQNNFVTRMKITSVLTEFLSALWQRGALVGAVPEEAFFVKCDDTNNPPEERANGKLLAEVGVAPSVPFEFIVVRVGREGNALEVRESAILGGCL